MTPAPASADDALPPISGRSQGSFAWSVLAHRHPAIVEQVRAAHPYGPQQHRALDLLRAEIDGGVVGPLSAAGSSASPGWDRWAQPHLGGSWFDPPFLWAESWFYRRLLDAVGYFSPGPWHGVDPFAPMKAAELERSGRRAPGASGGQAAGPPSRQDLLLGAVWGNRADLGFRATSAPGEQDSGDLLVDESAAVWQRLEERPRPLCLVTDNAGGELVADLLLVDRLLADGLVTAVTLQVKPDPYFVSDAVTADVVACLVALADPQRDGANPDAAARLRDRARQGRLVVQAHPFWFSPLDYRSLPADLAADLAGFGLVLLKGDLSYRRLVGDRAWPATTAFDRLTASFPAPLAVLRTCKSEVVVGLAAHRASALDDVEPGWRTSGRHAVVQTDLRPRTG